MTITVDAAQTGITSVYNASLKVGRDAGNLIDFATTDNKLIFRVECVNEVELVQNALSPVTSDGVALGTGSLMWSDAFLASGAVVNFNNGDVTLTHSACTLTVAGGTLAAAAITGTTIDASTDFTIGTTVITDDVVTFTPSSCDTVVMTAATNGAFSLVTTDTAAAAANIQITADGTVDIDSAGVLTLDSGAAINIEPASGSAILLDGTISVDAGVVTGATSVTSTHYVTGNNGTVKFLDGDGNKYFTLAAHACTTACIAYTFPPAGGSCGNVLTTNGSGALSWASASGGVTNVTGSCSAVVINECSGDVDFRVESNNNANAFTIDGAAFGGVGTMGIGTGAPGGSHVLVNHPATTITANDNFYRFYVGNSNAITVPSGTSAIVASLRVNEPNITETGTLTTGATVYIPGAPTEGGSNYSLFIDDGVSRFDGQIQAANGCASTPGFAFKCDTDVGFYRAAGNELGVSTNGTARFLFKGEEFHIGDCANGNMSRGLTINQGCADNIALDLKSTDVGTSLTAHESDSYMQIKKKGNCTGGFEMFGLGTCSGNVAAIHGIGCGQNTGKNTSSPGMIDLRAGKRNTSNNGIQSLGSDGNLVTINDHGVGIRFIFDVEGTAHADVGTATYDDYNDVELLRGFLATTCDTYKKNYQDKFGEDLIYNQQWYEDNKLIGKCSIHYETRECGRVQQRAMVNMTGLTMLHHSTIIQLSDRVNARLDGIETQLKALTEGK